MAGAATALRPAQHGQVWPQHLLNPVPPKPVPRVKLSFLVLTETPASGQRGEQCGRRTRPWTKDLGKFQEERCLNRGACLLQVTGNPTPNGFNHIGSYQLTYQKVWTLSSAKGAQGSHQGLKSLSFLSACLSALAGSLLQ